MKLISFCGAVAGCVWLGCACATGTEGLVPPTVTDDERLPRLEIDVAGHRRAIHLETFGDDDNPVLLVSHGGGGSDYKAMLPLQALADRYLVVMWDARGSGLSERITRGEVSLQSYADEVHAVKEHFSPHEPVSFIGYSSGGAHAGVWISRYPDDVDQLVLIESDPFSGAEQPELDVPFTEDWVNQLLFQNEFLTPDDHELADYKLFSVTNPALAALSCDPAHPNTYPMWRLGALVYLASNEMFHDFDVRAEVAALELDALLIATRCGPLGAEFQRAHLQPLFANTELVELERPTDHLNLFEHAETQVQRALRDYLRQYQEVAP